MFSNKTVRMDRIFTEGKKLWPEKFTLYFIQDPVK